MSSVMLRMCDFYKYHLKPNSRMEASGSFSDYLRCYSTSADFHIHDCLQFLSVDFQIYIQHATGYTHTHTQTMRVMAGRHSGLHPVVSLHASKLFSVTQILIWKSQLTELTESREKGSQDPPSSFHCPPLLAPLLNLTFDASCRWSLLHIHSRQDTARAKNEGRINKSSVGSTLDYKSWPWKPSSESAELHPAATCVSDRIDPTLCASDDRTNFSIFASQTRCDCLTNLTLACV